MRAIVTPTPKWKIYDGHSLDLIPQLRNVSEDIRSGIRLASLVFPFKVNEYVLKNLIDWTCVPDDPIFRLVFPMQEMLSVVDRTELAALVGAHASQAQIALAVERMRIRMNPDPSDQSVNAPLVNGYRAEGIQHKYKETVLAFPKQGQTCHSYCSFCFRWPQFVDTQLPRFELPSASQLHAYLLANREVSELLLTGGDPLVMSSRRLAEYLETLLRPEFAHVHTIRLGTKALTYWPYRFLGGDADQLFVLLRKLIEGGKHITLMAHLNHWRELSTEPAQRAIDLLQRAGVVIRTQSPLLRQINDDSETWRRNWRDQIRLGLIPYYVFVERDTGAAQYFRVPLARALSILGEATLGMSGLARTVRGPVMSASPGKVHVHGTIVLDGARHFVLSFIRARRESWVNRLFLAKYSETAHWLSDLVPSDGTHSFFFEAEHSAILRERRSRDSQLGAIAS